MRVSIVIPALNEEKLLPHLLDDLKNQSYPDYEVIVSDAGSSDRTVTIAREFGAIVTKGGLPAVGRNNGARIVTGEFIFFLDADVRVPPDFIETATNEIEERFLDLATCEFHPLSEEPFDKLLHSFVNTAIKLYQFIDPHAPGCCILVSRRLFHRIHGFDETLRLAEDHNFVKRASVFRPLRVLESTHIDVSTRRLDKEGRVQLTNKYLQVELHRLLKGEIRNNIIEYEFGKFDELRKVPSFPATWKEGKERIVRLNKRLTEVFGNHLDSELMTAEFTENLEEIKGQFDKLKAEFRSIFKL